MINYFSYLLIITIFNIFFFFMILVNITLIRDKEIFYLSFDEIEIQQIYVVKRENSLK